MAKNKGMVSRIASERISILYSLAVRALPDEPKLAHDYTTTIIRIAEHYRIRFDPEVRAHICRKCMMPLAEGLNADMRVIARDRRKIIRCRKCGSTNSLKFAT
jgi:ribonuclease P protein subunit RPR2